MRIGVDIRTLSFRKGGISQYTYNLLKNILLIDDSNQYYLFNHNKSQYEWDNFKGNVREIILRLPQRYNLRLLWENLLVPIAIKKIGIDLWFSPDFFIPRSLKIPSIVTVHDLIFMKFHHPEINKLSQQLIKKMAYSIKKTNQLIVNSNYTLTVVNKEYNIEDDRIKVIYEAAHERFHKINEPKLIKRVLSRYGIGFKYILFVGEISKRKNLVNLFGAYNILKRDKRLDGRKLLIVGKKTVDTDKILNEMSSLDLVSDVFFTGFIPDEDLPFIYNGADLFIFPSLYEGFGLPPLEAMQCEIPVTASNATSIPEVVGDGALLFDPHDPHDIADKIDAVINSKIDVNNLKAKAIRQAKKFSWAKTAKQTMELFNLCSQ